MAGGQAAANPAVDARAVALGNLGGGGPPLSMGNASEPEEAQTWTSDGTEPEP